MDESEVKTTWIRLDLVVRGAPKHPVAIAEYNAWLLRLQKANDELTKALYPEEEQA